MVVLLSSAVFLTACYTENSDPMKENISSFDNKIESIDKTIASPRDVVTVKGKDLDKVYKIMLGTNLSIIKFTVKSSTELEFTIPTSAPLGDVIVINFFFEGNGLAQRHIEIMSPPVILGFSPVAAKGGESLRLMGAELYKASKVYVGDEEVEFELINDKNINIKTLPTITDGVKLKVIDETGATIESENGIKRGTELLVTDFDSNDGYYTSMSPNGNLPKDAAEEVPGEPPYNKYYTFTFVDKATSWGGNLDLNFEGIPASYDDNTKVWLYIDLKLSDNLTENKKTRIMVEGPAGVYGDDYQVTTEWQTFKLKLSEAYTGYGNGEEQGAAPIMSLLKGAKVQPPAQASEGNFGKVLFVDNIRFVVEE